MKSFTEFNLLPSLQATLVEKKIFKPTEIQTRTITLMMEGKSLVGVSETGSGKTLSYALPLLHVMKNLEDNGNPVEIERAPRAIVMVPTRELGEQVSKVFKTFTHGTRLRVRPALGGMAFEQARRNTSGAFEILLATPGRLIQMMQRKIIDLSEVRTLIFDEADQMLDINFLSDSEKIVHACPEGVQLALFSATVSSSVEKLMNTLFASAQVVRSSGSGKTVASLITQNKIVKDGKRWPILVELLEKPVNGGTLIFTNTREQCDKLAQELIDKGLFCAVYRGDMDKSLRRTNFKKFRDGELDILVSTDLASRGLDLESVGRVINYHLPQQMENYLHRVGRTARAGRSGLVVNLVTERDQNLILALESMKSGIKGAVVSKIPPTAFRKSKPPEKIMYGNRSDGRQTGPTGNRGADGRSENRTRKRTEKKSFAEAPFETKPSAKKSFDKKPSFKSGKLFSKGEKTFGLGSSSEKDKASDKDLKPVRKQAPTFAKPAPRFARGQKSATRR